MAKVKGNKAAIYLRTTDAATPTTGEQMDSAGDNWYKVHTASKAHWDRSSTITIKDGGVAIAASKILKIAYEGGYVQLDEPATGAVTADFSYFAVAQVGGVKGFDLDINILTDDAGHLEDEGAMPEPMGQKWSLKADKHWWDTRASLTLDPVGDNNGMILTSKVPGARGNDISYEQRGGTSQTLGVTVDGYDIIVQLGTNGSGTVTSTVNDVRAALYNSSAVMRLLSAIENAVGSTGAGLPAVAAHTHLAGGIDPDWIGRAIVGAKLNLIAYINNDVGELQRWDGVGVIKGAQEQMVYGKMTSEPLTIEGYDSIFWHTG